VTSFNQGGYWNVTCQVVANYNDGVCGNVWSGSGKTVVTQAAPQVTILIKPDGTAKYMAITKDNNNLLPGQKVDLQANVVPAPNQATYKWKLPGTVFKDYNAGPGTTTPDGGAGILTKIDPDLKNPTDTVSQTVQFYWADTGNGRDVTCTVTIGGKDCPVKGTLNVIKPKASLTPYQGTTSVSKDGKEIGLYPVGDLTNGMEFIGMVDTPQGFANGKWNWVQLVKFDIQKTIRPVQKELQVQSKNFGKWVLDTTYPYKPRPDIPKGGKGVPGSYASDGGYHMNGDTPGVPLRWPTDDLSINSVFTGKTYLMFLPPGPNSRYVPLIFIDSWSWKFQVSKGANGWTLAPNGFLGL
jgi:hypothetical protein